MTFRTLVLFALLHSLAQAQIGYPPAKPASETRQPVFKSTSTAGPLANFHLHFDYSSPKPTTLTVGDHPLALPAGDHLLELIHDHPENEPGQLTTRLDRAHTADTHKLSDAAAGTTLTSDDPALRCDRDYSVSVRFRSDGGSGTLFSKCEPGDADWAPDAKALFIRGGRLVYDIGWVGAMTARPKVNDGKDHHAILVVRDGNAELFLDGKSVARKRNFNAPDKKGHVFKIGEAAPDFAHDFKNGIIHNLQYFPKALTKDERNKENPVHPTLNWHPTPLAETFDGTGIEGVPITLTLKQPEGFKLNTAWVQPLGTADHAALIRAWDDDSLTRGKTIYHTLCVTCHGTTTLPGTLPTALRFHEQPFKNGADPYRMFQTLDKGYGLMVPQPQYTAAQKYDLIHYIRETFLKPHNPSQYTTITDAYLDELPAKRPSHTETPAPAEAHGKPYEQMDFGPFLMWTYQVNKGQTPRNFAQKGIAIRLDDGPGGVSKGSAHIVYDQDTMRVAAITSGEPSERGEAFIDWRGIAFDGSHGTHASLTAPPLFLTPDAPAWRHPTGTHYDDQRIIGRDDRHFGPLPRDWVHYKGLYRHLNTVVLNYTVGDATLLESPGVIQYGDASVFTRTLNIGKSSTDIVHRLCPNNETLSVALNAPDGATLTRDGEHIELHIPAKHTPINLVVGMSTLDPASLDSLLPPPLSLIPQTKGSWEGAPKPVITQGVVGDEDSPFTVDHLTLPDRATTPGNPWMRLGGFDFFPDNPDRAAVCTWLGDVWLVDGVSSKNLDNLTWRRICTGLFQPLGLKIHRGNIHVTCRDQIARLHDLNGDNHIDYIESVNNDHQVTEHFHEFAMGLQIDDAGNFYYAKSARHAKPALVPHHGTLLRVSADGQRTDILATGFRAANGVCLNPDGTFFVTDQEGHWTPKNRINHVREGGFYGNTLGYHELDDTSDTAMQHPLCWITNAKDRSPAELIWVPQTAGSKEKWGRLSGTLLNLSYGYGQIYTVPHETINGQAQGGVCELPIDRLPSGLHRGRFHPETHDLYGVGMFAWAGNQRADGGFYRIRPNPNSTTPAYLPTAIKTAPQTITLTFTDPLPKDATFHIKTWDLKRTRNYGSRHHNEKKLSVTATLNGHTATLRIPNLKPTWCMEIACQFGDEERIIHNSIHAIHNVRD